MSITVNWNEHASATPIGVLSGGLHKAVVISHKYFADDGRLYYYMTTDDGESDGVPVSVNHRESFSLPKGFGYLRAMVESSGAPASVFKKSAFDPAVLETKTVYFNYTPPERVTNDGRPAEGCYPRYVFYRKARWEQLVAIRNIRLSDTETETSGAASNDELDFDSNA